MCVLEGSERPYPLNEPFERFFGLRLGVPVQILRWPRVEFTLKTPDIFYGPKGIR